MLKLIIIGKINVKNKSVFCSHINILENFDKPFRLPPQECLVRFKKGSSTKFYSEHAASMLVADDERFCRKNERKIEFRR